MKPPSNNIQLSRRSNLIILMVFPLTLFTIAIILDSSGIFRGLFEIIISKDILLIDYLKIGGIGGTFFNVSVISIFNIFLIYIFKLKVNGALIAAILTIMGFSFMGKSIYNIIPMYLGGILYCKYKKIEFKNILITIIFSTALAPLVSEISFATELSLKIGLPLGIIFGIIAGFIITPLSSHMVLIHNGYNLYNVGFTAGIIATIINSILKGYGITIVQQENLSYEYDIILKLIITIFSLFLIIIGFILNGKSFKGYFEILNFSGRLVTDFTQHLDYGITYINMGIMGIISIIYVILMNGVFNGPIIGGILTIIGFSAFGKHPKNCLPIMIGVSLAGLIKVWDISSTSVIIAGLFGTTLAPIAGKYGILAGIFAGLIHLSVAKNIGLVHGGINLYNNGFSGGIIAAMLYPLLEAFKEGD